MHFERSLKKATYAPWREQYIDYTKLKSLLKDYESDAEEDNKERSPTVGSDAESWTDKDEEAFVEELINVQLEKVHGFQSVTIQNLRERTAKCEERLETIAPRQIIEEASPATNEDAVEPTDPAAPDEDLDEEARETLQTVLKELDAITKEMNELERYSRINYTGFMKATKKHDRKRGRAYRIRPLMLERLTALPFNKEDYSPLLFRLSTMYAFIRQRLDRKGKRKGVSFSESQIGTEDYTAHKCRSAHKLSRLHLNL